MRMRFLFAISMLVFLSCTAFTKPNISAPKKGGDKDKMWVVDSTNKIRYMRKVVVLNKREWKPDRAELNFQIADASLKGLKKKSLEVKVKYGGGCRVHRFQLIKPVQTSKDTLQLYLTHEGNNDNCRAFVMNEMTFDVAKLKLKKNKKTILINNITVQ